MFVLGKLYALVVQLVDEILILSDLFCGFNLVQPFSVGQSQLGC